MPVIYVAEEAAASASEIAFRATDDLDVFGRAVIVVDGVRGWQRSQIAVEAHQEAARLWWEAYSDQLPWQSQRNRERSKRHENWARGHRRHIPQSEGGEMTPSVEEEVELGWRVEAATYEGMGAAEAEREALDNVALTPRYYSELFAAIRRVEPDNKIWSAAKAGHLAAIGIRQLAAAITDDTPLGQRTALLVKANSARLEAVLANLVLAEATPERSNEQPGRTLRRDGRWQPALGDRVFRRVSGMGGTPASQTGIVKKGRNGLTVTELKTSGLFGSKEHRAQRLDDSWSVVGDPNANIGDSVYLVRLRRDHESLEASSRQEREAARKSAAVAVARGASPLTRHTPAQHAIYDHLAKRAARLVSNDAWDGAEALWDDLGRTILVRSQHPFITVDLTEPLQPLMRVFLSAMGPDAPNDESLEVSDLKHASRVAVAWKQAHGIPESRWIDAVVSVDGLRRAEVRFDGTVVKKEP